MPTEAKKPPRERRSQVEPYPKAVLREVTGPELIAKANTSFDNLLLAKLIVDVLNLAEELDRLAVRETRYGVFTFSPWEMVVMARNAEHLEEVARLRGAMMASRDSAQPKGIVQRFMRRLGVRA